MQGNNYCCDWEQRLGIPFDVHRVYLDPFIFQRWWLGRRDTLFESPGNEEDDRNFRQRHEEQLVVGSKPGVAVVEVRRKLHSHVHKITKCMGCCNVDLCLAIFIERTDICPQHSVLDITTVGYIKTRLVTKRIRIKRV